MQATVKSLATLLGVLEIFLMVEGCSLVDRPPPGRAPLDQVWEELMLAGRSAHWVNGKELPWAMEMEDRIATTPAGANVTRYAIVVEYRGHFGQGSWYLSGGLQNRGLAAYRRAWKEFELGGSTAALAAPRQLAYRAPLAAVSRAKGDRDELEEHFVEVSFTVSSEGRTSDVTTVEADAPLPQQKAVLFAVRRARYAPRFENAAAVETSGVRFRERLLSKKN